MKRQQVKSMIWVYSCIKGHICFIQTQQIALRQYKLCQIRSNLINDCKLVVSASSGETRPVVGQEGMVEAFGG